MPALTVNRHGAGRVYYLAARPAGDAFHDGFARGLVRELKLARNLDVELPEGVTVQRREGGGRTFLFLHNFAPEGAGARPRRDAAGRRDGRLDADRKGDAAPVRLARRREGLTILRAVSLSKQILVALVAGVAVGLFFGDKVAFLEIGGRAFVQALQVTVLPYVAGSLIAGFGSMKREDARLLASRGGLLLVALWGLSLGLVFLFPLALPSGKGGAFFSFAGLEPERAIDWLDLYIPANPFRSLANNVVPAVVVFAVLAGVGLMALPRKQVLLEPLDVFNEAMGRVGSLLARLTPLGIFAIAGNTAGTMQLEEFGRLQGFVLTYAVFACLLTFWLLPGLVAALTPVGHRRMITLAQDALVTAFVTSNLFIVLPILVERSRTLLAERRAKDGGTDGERENELVDVLVPMSFNFPHGAKVLSIGFVLFAGWYAGVEIPAARYPALGGAGLLAVFGSINTAIPFLLDLVRVPADLFQLFVVSGVLNSRFGAMTSAMHTLVVAVLGTCLVTGRIELRRARLARYLAVSALLVAGAVLGSRALLARILPEPARAAELLGGLAPRPPLAPVTLLRTPAAPAGAAHAAGRAARRDPRERAAARGLRRRLGAVGLREREGRGRRLRRGDGPLAGPPARGPPRVRAPAAGPGAHRRGAGLRGGRRDHVRRARVHPQRRARGLLAALCRGGGRVPGGGPPAGGVRERSPVSAGGGCGSARRRSRSGSRRCSARCPRRRSCR